MALSALILVMFILQYFPLNVHLTLFCWMKDQNSGKVS